MTAALSTIACASSGGAGDDTTGDGESSTGSSSGALDEGSTAVADASSGSSSEGGSESSTGEPIIPIDCTEACVDTVSVAGISLCHSCNCKAAFDNWLPTRDEVQCSQATPIIAYHADVTSGALELVPAADGASSCANPSLLTGSCLQGSRLGQLQHGDVMLRWICRDPHVEGGVIRYDDVGAIGHNVRTGATCFWDDIDDVTHDDDLPPLDLLEASDEERVAYDEVFYFTDGKSCTNCHDHDPFIYSPYLQSTDWITVAADKGPYSLVDLDGTHVSTGVQHLVSPEVAACTACHRLGSNGTCDTFVYDSLGLLKDSFYEQEVHDAQMEGSPFWNLAIWMPDKSLPIRDYAAWVNAFAGARSHIQDCCAAPGVESSGCQWDAVPSE
jgi:hypothetical protein